MGLHDKIVEYQWSGKTRYRCPLCPADARTKVEIKVHLNTMHLDQIVEARRMGAELYDHEGNLIEYMPSSEGQKKLPGTATEATIERRT